jgi:hypothetical protein
VIYLDKNGKRISSKKFTNGVLFIDGYACVEVDNSYWYIMDKKGRLSAKSFRTNNTPEFSDGLVVLKDVHSLGDYWKALDENGDVVFSGNYEMIENFVNGFTIAVLPKKNEIYGKKKVALLNKKGEVLAHCYGYDSIDYHISPFKVTNDSKVYYLNEEGKQIAGPFSEGTVFLDDFAVVRQNRKSFFINKFGERAFRDEFDLIESGRFQNGVVKVTKGKESFYIDKHGRRIFG